MEIKTDCQYFNGYKPCKPHKETGIHCDQCKMYKSARHKILILKAGLAGEVLRCTPILRRLRAIFPDADITWVTDFPDFVPAGWVTRILRHSWQTALRLQGENYDIVYSLDKDYDMCALAAMLKTKSLRGFKLDSNGKIIPAHPDSIKKWQTGIWDDLMIRNTTHYVAEIFEMCGFSWNGEEYILEGLVEGIDKRNRPLIGLNTGTSKVWRTRLWSEDNWLSLIQMLQENNQDVLLLGGPDEHEKNERLARLSNAMYNGIMPYKDFFKQINKIDVLVTGVTMALHVGIALKKPVILLNNIFNEHEFYLYERGEILQPNLKCLCCYKPDFDSGCPTRDCLSLISSQEVYKAIKRWVKSP